MEGSKSLLSDRLEAPKPHFPVRVESASPVPPERASPLTELASSQLHSEPEIPRSGVPGSGDGPKSLLLQGLEGTMALLAAKGVESAKAMYPQGMESLRPFLSYGEETATPYLHERMENTHKAVWERKEAGKGMEGSGGPETSEGKRCQQHERPREGKSGASRREQSPKGQQLSNPRHDAHLVHAIRELHEEEFGLDAVLLAEGGHVGAHCAVLAAASPFLKTLLLHANDHPAIISVTGTTLATLQALVTCLYTGTIPADASLYNLTEAAKLLKMDDLASVLQRTLLAQGGSLLDFSKSYPMRPSTGYLSQALEPRIERTGKKVRSNRLDQILYQKLNVNHLAPSDIADLTHVPLQDSPHVPPSDSPRVPILESSRVPPHDLRGGILGELLTKADPLRSVFSASAYMADLGLDSSGAPLRPLNLSKANKSHSPSSTSGMSPSYPGSASSTSFASSFSPSTTTATSTNPSIASAASAAESYLASLSSLSSSLPAGLLPLPATFSLMSQSALASLASSSSLASLSSQQPPGSMSPTKSTSSPNFSTSTSTSSSKNRSKRSSNSISSSSMDRNSSQHTLPLLYTLKSGMMTPEVAKEVYEQLKSNPNITSGYEYLHNMSGLNNSSTLQNLASLHNLSSLQRFPSLFNFLAPTSSESIMSGNSYSGAKKSRDSPVPLTSDFDTNASSLPNMNASNLSPVQAKCDEAHGALNLSSSATTRSESPDVVTVVDSPTPASSTDGSIIPSQLCVAVVEDDDDDSKTGSQNADGITHRAGDSVIDVVGHNEDSNTNDGAVSSARHSGISPLMSAGTDKSNLPLLLMTSGSTLSGLTQPPMDTKPPISIKDFSSDSQNACIMQEPKFKAEALDLSDDTGIEVVEEIPGINRCFAHARKTLYHANHIFQPQMGRKRKGCGECEGCQVVEDCGQCRFCRDKAKFGGPNRLKQVCVYKRCVLAEMEPEDSKKRRKSMAKKGRGKCGGCDGCQRTADCGECYACLHNAAAQPPARRKVCEMRVCEQQQIEEVRAALSAAEPSPYSTDSLMAESLGLGLNSGTSSPTPEGIPSTHNDKMKLMRKMLKKKFAQPYSRVSPSKVRTKYYCGECPGCLTTTPCGNCLYCEDMPKFGGPGRYRQKCVKQLCVYHPRLQALKLSNRSKITYDGVHIGHETLSHLSCVPEEAVHLGCDISPMSRDHLEEIESIEEIDPTEETDGVTEGEDSNAPLQHAPINMKIFAPKAEDLSLKISPEPKPSDVPLEPVVCPAREEAPLPSSDPVTTDSHNSTPAKAQNDEVQPKEIATEEGEDDLEEIEEEEEEEDDAIVSEASDVPSPASTPSPCPRVLGRKHNRGRGRGRGKVTRASVARQATRRGSRRRTTRFTLGPEDHSDFEDELMLDREIQSIVKEPQGQDRSQTKERNGKSLPKESNGDLMPLDRIEEDVNNDSQGTKESPVETGDNTAAENNEDQRYANPAVQVRGDIQTVIEADRVLKGPLQDRPQSIGDNIDTVGQKYNGPYAFHDEESSQGGRDVNENLGSVSETATA